MVGRIARIGSCGALVVSIVSIWLGIDACYNPPKPECGFVCGPAGECPDDYHCDVDKRCHLIGTLTSLMCVDAGPPPDTMHDAPIDARPDAPPDAHPDAPDASLDAFVFLDAI